MNVCKPLISVILPFYNRSNTIHRACRSVLSQTYSNIELILVNDGSTDDSVDIINQFHDSRIKLINQSNQGACAARNNGILNSTGEYIAFQDSDDEWRPEKLQIQFDALQQSGADVCFCRFLKHNLSDNCTDKWPEVYFGVISAKQLIKESLVSTQTILAKRQLFMNSMFDVNLKRLQDYEWVISVCKNYSFYLVDQILVDVYLQNDSLTLSGNEKLCESFEYILKKHFSDYNNCPEIQAYMLENYGRSLARLNYNPNKIYMKALRRYLHINTFIKYLLSYVGIYK